MKQFKPSYVLTLIICILIGYFEPANAQDILVVNGDGNVTQVYPNPVPSGQGLFTAANDQIVSASVISLDGSVNLPCIVVQQQFEPVMVVDTTISVDSSVVVQQQFEPIMQNTSLNQGGIVVLQQFEPIILKNWSTTEIPQLTYSNVTLPSLRSGSSYYLVIVGANGKYSTIITIQ